MPTPTNIYISVVMPCLNEAESVGRCVEQAVQALKNADLDGEVIVADNGSTDNSVEIATRAGAQVVHQPERGYGNAYHKGLATAKGNILVIGDSDSTYDFGCIPELITPFKDGYDMVMGSRFMGTILPGAMPFMNRYIGNPILTGMLNLLFGLKISDAHTGMRAMTREAYDRMALRTTGMEFASELVIQAVRAGLKIKEIPITYYPRVGRSKLNAVRDAWRHVRFMLMYSPTAVFTWPGVIMILLGAIPLIFLLPGPIRLPSGGIIDYHWMIAGALLVTVGTQLVMLGLISRTYAAVEGFNPADGTLRRLWKWFSLERALLLSGVLLLIGFILIARLVLLWAESGFSILGEIRSGLLAMTLAAAGMQIGTSAFFLSLLLLPHRRINPPQN
jgi:glycosyltransferase involved in cell wall biosynthesis